MKLDSAAGFSSACHSTWPSLRLTTRFTLRSARQHLTGRARIQRLAHQTIGSLKSIRMPDTMIGRFTAPWQGG
jgi:hypothetical protein